MEHGRDQCSNSLTVRRRLGPPLDRPLRSAPAPWTTRRYVISNDPMVEPPSTREHIGNPKMSRWEENGSELGNSTRMIYPAMAGVCTGSYAISQRGARKLLYRMSLQPFNNPVDWGMNYACADRTFGLNCVATYPTIIGLYRPAGNWSKHSDIGYMPEADMGIQEEGISQRIVFSTRKNLERLFREDYEFESNYPDHISPKMNFNDIISAVGHPEEVPLDQRFLDYTNEQFMSLEWNKQGLE
ncbi:uncharacterized protein AB675_350 [Cyphellophora attinorum]|uniref:Uncharacterized protein n=1 Tax=Cyphellophora attinorum TaxID=1664694 RepID=A0A0N1HHM9_9EURO|nr:uncharacterized protein AB675_350 [Phialophora attinorum]KPI45562.1 hypothetical protein AB675_350 [Phialophora attinorum]